MCTMLASVPFLCNFFDHYGTLSNLKDLVTCITLPFGALIAARGLKTWKLQLKGNQDYQLAKALLVQLFKYKDRIYQFRHPAFFNAEYPEFAPGEILNSSPEARRYKNLSYAYQNRYEKIGLVKPILEELIIESQAIWDDDVRTNFLELFMLENNLSNAIRNHLHNINPEHRLDEKIDVDKRVIFDSLTEDDMFRKECDSKVDAIATILRPKLKL